MTVPNDMEEGANLRALSPTVPRTGYGNIKLMRYHLCRSLTCGS